MKNLLNVLKLAGVFICIALLIAFMFFDIIDWLIPGDFPEWVYVVEIAAWVIFAVVALVVFIRKRREQ